MKETCKAILLVEDDQVDAMTVRRALKELRVTNRLEHMENGEDALAFLRDVTKERPCLILLDLNMPIMNGLECTKLIRELETSKNWRTPIIGVSAHTSDSCSRLCLAGGMDDYLSKPFDSSHFQNTLAHWTSGTNRPALRVLPNAPDSEENRESASA